MSWLKLRDVPVCGGNLERIRRQVDGGATFVVDRANAFVARQRGVLGPANEKHVIDGRAILARQSAGRSDID